MGRIIRQRSDIEVDLRGQSAIGAVAQLRYKAERLHKDPRWASIYLCSNSKLETINWFLIFETFNNFLKTWNFNNLCFEISGDMRI